MASLTIRNVDDELKSLLRQQAARHGCSMEQEVREILRRAVQTQPAGAGFAQRIQRRFAGLDADDSRPLGVRCSGRCGAKLAHFFFAGVGVHSQPGIVSS